MSLVGQPMSVYAQDETIIFSGVVVESQPHPASGSWSVLIEVVETNVKRCTFPVGTVVKMNCDHWDMTVPNRLRLLHGPEAERILGLCTDLHKTSAPPSNGASASAAPAVYKKVYKKDPI